MLTRCSSYNLPVVFTARRLIARESSPRYLSSSSVPLCEIELIEQALSLLYAALGTSEAAIRESLLFILEEKLVMLASHLTKDEHHS